MIEKIPAALGSSVPCLSSPGGWAAVFTWPEAAGSGITELGFGAGHHFETKPAGAFPGLDAGKMKLDAGTAISYNTPKGKPERTMVTDVFIRHSPKEGPAAVPQTAASPRAAPALRRGKNLPDVVKTTLLVSMAMLALWEDGMGQTMTGTQLQEKPRPSPPSSQVSGTTDSTAAPDKFAEAGKSYEKGLDCYYGADGVAVDRVKAAELILRAADQGLPEAEAGLAALYQVGEGRARDEARAKDWAQKAVADGLEARARPGNIRAELQLGVLYQLGLGVTQSYTRAAELFQEGADRGFAHAQYELGWAYENGNGVQKNCPKAAELFQKAADQGDAVAQYRSWLAL